MTSTHNSAHLYKAKQVVDTDLQSSRYTSYIPSPTSQNRLQVSNDLPGVTLIHCLTNPWYDLLYSTGHIDCDAITGCITLGPFAVVVFKSTTQPRDHSTPDFSRLTHCELLPTAQLQLSHGRFRHLASRFKSMRLSSAKVLQYPFYQIEFERRRTIVEIRASVWQPGLPRW